jgi:hypothetical protein
MYHQLHCLNHLRLGYYKAKKGIESENSDPHVEPVHIRHCFDYLRQSLICAADSNLEPVHLDLGGVTGWSSARVCRDHQRLAELTAEWKCVKNEGCGPNLRSI